VALAGAKMTDLQQARADYIETLQKLVTAEAEVERLKCANFELQSRLFMAQTQLAVHGAMSEVLRMMFAKEI
jgi:hypothetical protein